MARKKALVLSLLLLSLLAPTVFSMGIKPSTANGGSAKVRFIPERSELGPQNEIGNEIKVAVVVENVTNLYGLSVKVYINDTYFEYVSHTTTIPVEDYPDPIDPSPYPGILYENVVAAKDEYDPDTHILEVAYSSQAPAPTFNGSGTVCTITLKVINHPIGDGSINVLAAKLVEVKLAGYGVPPPPIPYTSEDLVLTMNLRAQPPGPTLKIDEYNYEGATPHYAAINVSILNLDEYWDLTGFDLKLSFDPKTIQVENVILGEFSIRFNLTYQVYREIDNENGTLWIVYMLNPSVLNDSRTIPHGNGTLLTIEINANFSSPIKFVETKLSAMPHPERSEPPWNNQPYSIAIPHNRIDGKANIVSVRSYPIVDDLSVTVKSNYYIDLAYASTTTATVIFNVYVSPGETANTTIYVPLDLMFPADTFMVLVNGLPADANIVYNATHAIINVSYTDEAISLAIQSENMIPEYSIWFLLSAILSTAGIIFFLKKHPLSF